MSIDSIPQWLPAPFSLELGANEVHLWRASLDCDPAVRSRLEGTLAPDELARADRFVFADRSQSLRGGAGNSS